MTHCRHSINIIHTHTHTHIFVYIYICIYTYIFIKELTGDHYSINKIKLYQIFLVEVKYVLIKIKVRIFQVNLGWIKLLLCKKKIGTVDHIEILPVVMVERKRSIYIDSWGREKQPVGTLARIWQEGSVGLKWIASGPVWITGTLA